MAIADYCMFSYLSTCFINKKAPMSPPSPLLVSLQGEAIKAIICHSTDGKSSDFFSSVEPEKRIAYLHTYINSTIIFTSNSILFLYIINIFFSYHFSLLPAISQ